MLCIYLADARTAGFTDDGILDSNNARSALSLATNMTTRPLVGVCAFACISALTAVLLATQTDFFGKKYNATDLTSIDELRDLWFCGSIMFRACVLVSSNCFSVIFLFYFFISTNNSFSFHKRSPSIWKKKKQNLQHFGKYFRSFFFAHFYFPHNKMLNSLNPKDCNSQNIQPFKRSRNFSEISQRLSVLK